MQAAAAARKIALAAAVWVIAVRRLEWCVCPAAGPPQLQSRLQGFADRAVEGDGQRPRRLPEGGLEAMPCAAGPSRASCERREAVAAAAAAAVAVGLRSPSEMAAWAEAAALPEVKMDQLNLGVGTVAEDLVYPAWFKGEWACAAQLYQVEAGKKGGEKGLAAALPGAELVLRAAGQAVGTDAGEFVARRRWEATSRKSPGAADGAGGAMEDRAGTSVGVVAAAQALAGPAAPVRQPSGQEDTWEVGAVGEARWRLKSAGATARLDPTLGEGGFRVFELFEATKSGTKVGAEGGGGSAAVRVGTYWRKTPNNATSGIGPEASDQGFGLGKADPSRPFLLQAIQVVYLLGDPSARNDQSLATYTTRFLYTPILPSRQ